VNALAASPWGTFSIAMTIPIALLMGVYLRVLRPGRVAEVSLIGVALLLLAPRDYLSTFMKIGTIALLALGVVVALPTLKMDAVTDFASRGDGPVFAGSLFPFVFITIACGALSGFHSLISSGTTPKLLEKESQMRLIGYGGMITESFVAVMALITAS